MRMAYTTNEKLPKLRAKAVRMVRDGKSQSEVAKYFGYQQGTISKWCAKAPKTFLPKRIETCSSRPLNSPSSIPDELVAKIIHTRISTKRCSEVVHQHLIRDGVVTSLSTVKRNLSKFGLLKRRSPWKKKRRYPVRPDITKQGDLVQLDTIHFVDRYGARTYIFTAIDVFSRYGYADWSKKSNTHTSIRFLNKVQKYFPFEIRNIQTDNGSEFGKFFTDTVIRRGMAHRHIHPRSPNENGHLERFNRTLQEEIPKRGLCIYIKDDISKFLSYYNTERIHMGINYKTPAEMLVKLFQGVDC